MGSTALLSALALALVLLLAAASAYGAWRWRTRTQALHARLLALSAPVPSRRYDARETAALPAPVRRYFQAVLRDGQPLVAWARFAHRGHFNLGQARPQWRPFESAQMAVTQRPGFVWDGRIRMAPLVPVHVHDAYVGGEGLLHAQLLGLVTLAHLRSRTELAQGELVRFLAEAPWYPTALLPSQGVQWQAIDEHAAQATLSDGEHTVSLVFLFDAQNLVCGVRSAARARAVNGTMVATPWQGRFWNYAWRGGMQIPLEGEVAWELPQGLWPYWRGQLTHIAHGWVP